MWAAPAMASEEAGKLPFRWFPGTAVFAIVLAVLHLLGPLIRRLLQGREPIVASFGGGMAAAYVFVHLLPALDKGHAIFGSLIFVVALASFVIFYGVSKGLHLLSQRPTRKGEEAYLVRLSAVQMAVCNWLIVYGTPSEAAESGWRAAALVVAMGLHLIHSDFSLGNQHPRMFDARVRYWLAIAAIVGWLTVIANQKTNDTVNDLFIAILAGSLLYSVFSEEIPEYDESRYWWFLTGVVGFVAFVAFYI
jgi:hypothetical protein